MELTGDARRVLERLAPLPKRVRRPLLIVLVGPPATGKTTFARLLAERCPVVTVSTDNIRKLLVGVPQYTDAEHARVFTAAYRLLAYLLRSGIPAVFDATNLQHELRRRAYRIAEAAGAEVAVVSFETPPDIVRERLERRRAHPEHYDLSDATWEVYERLAATAEPIRGPYLAVRSEADAPAVLEVIESMVRSER